MDNHDEKLVKKLGEFHVDVPEFPMRKTKIDRLANWLFEEVPFPSVSMNLTGKGMIFIQMMPLVIIVLTLIPLLF